MELNDRQKKIVLPAVVVALINSNTFEGRILEESLKRFREDELREVKLSDSEL